MLPMVALAAWGSTFYWVRLALDAGMFPWLGTWGRFAVAAAILLPLDWPRWRSRGVPGPKIADLALAALLCNALPFTLVRVGHQAVTVGLAGILTSTTPCGRSFSRPRSGPGPRPIT
jgi:drug/metabolite transporter (DMT)-like permease